MTWHVSMWAELLILAAGRRRLERCPAQLGGQWERGGMGGRAIQNSGQEPWVAPKQQLRVCVGGQFPLEDPIGCSRHHVES